MEASVGLGVWGGVFRAVLLRARSVGLIRLL
jgi:hypothetical protein